MITTFLVRKNSKGKIQFLELNLQEATVSRRWGILEGKTQETQNIYDCINKGKANELSPEQAAKADYDRIIQTKINEGMVIVPDLNTLPDFNTIPEIDLSNIPKSLCCSKPTQQINERALQKIIDAGNAKFFIKYNGLCHFIVKNLDSDIRIYTRRWDDHTTKYPEIVKDFQECDYPAGTMIIAEFTIDPGLFLPHMEAFSLMSSISKADTVKGVCKETLPKTKTLQSLNRVRAAMFGILYCAGEPSWHHKYKILLNSLKIKAPKITANKAVFVPSEVPVSSAIQAFDLVRKNKTKIEGLIVWDVTQAMKMTMNGKPDRVAAWKIKAKGEDDVIAYDWVAGTGRNSDKVGSLKIGKYTSEGQLIALGTVSGLKAKQRDPTQWEFPCVIAIEYDQIFPDTGKYQFGHFLKLHEDKTVADVETFSIV